MKFSFGCLILKGPYFNKALQTKFPKLKTFQIVHLKAQVFFPTISSLQKQKILLFKDFHRRAKDGSFLIQLKLN